MRLVSCMNNSEVQGITVFKIVIRGGSEILFYRHTSARRKTPFAIVLFSVKLSAFLIFHIFFFHVLLFTKLKWGDSNVKADVCQWKATLCDDVRFLTVYCRKYRHNFLRHTIRRFVMFAKAVELGDNCIQNVHLGRYIVGYMVGYLVLRCVSGAVKLNFRLYNRRYTSPHEHFEYGHPHSKAPFNIYSSKAQHSAPNWSFISNAKQQRQPIKSDVTSEVRQYIAEYTDANSWLYPIRRHVIFELGRDKMISAFVVHCLGSIISLDFIAEISRL